MQTAKRFVSLVLIPAFILAACPEVASATSAPTWVFQAENGYLVTIVDQGQTAESLEGGTALQLSTTVISPESEEMNLELSMTEVDGQLSVKTTVDGGMSFEISGSQLADGSYGLDTLRLRIPGERAQIEVELPIEALQNQQISKAQEAALLTMFEGIRGTRSAEFAAGAAQALSEATTAGSSGANILNPILACILAIIGYIASIPPLASCAAVWPCVWAIMLHYGAIAGMVDACVDR